MVTKHDGNVWKVLAWSTVYEAEPQNLIEYRAALIAKGYLCKTMPIPAAKVMLLFWRRPRKSEKRT